MAKQAARFKKGRPNRFRKGNLVRALPPKSDSALVPASVSIWNCHPVYVPEIDSSAWENSAKVIGLMFSAQVFTVIDTHNFPFPSKEQYCLVFGAKCQQGWVSSRFLEKIQ